MPAKSPASVNVGASIRLALTRERQFRNLPAVMSRHIGLPLLTFCLALLAPARADDAALTVAPQPGVVLLRNGQALAGNISRAGEEYYIALPSGEIRLRANQVELVCRDLQEGYERKRSRMDPERLADHLDLAIWCIRQRLFEEANQEIADARTIDAKHARITLVERQLKLAQQQPTQNEHRTFTSDSGPSTEDLDRLLRGMPHGTVETFSSTIQPLLLNTCGNAGCHGPQSESKLRLLRTQLGKSSNRRFTQRNLYAVIEMINRSDPPASQLLTAPVAPHGTAKAAIFTNKEVVQYRQLVQWVMRVASGPVNEQPASVERSAEPLLQRLPAATKSTGEITPANLLLVGRSEARAPAASVGKNVDKKPARKQPAASDDPPGDPFDPEIFNRQFLPPE
jgi:hypothetical protein